MGLFDVITDTINLVKATKRISADKDGIHLRELNDRSLLTLYDMHKDDPNKNNIQALINELKRRGLK